MPTYEYQCPTCGKQDSRLQTIRQYCESPDTPECCSGLMERRLSVVPGMAVGNALAGDRHYDGLRATDGTPIDSRSKHRAYMKAKGLTTVDDYSQTWKKQFDERQKFRQGAPTPDLRSDIAEVLHTKTA